MNLRLAKDKEDLIFLYNTRRDESISKMLTGSPPEDYESHIKYIDRVQEKIRWIFIAFNEKERVGYCQIYDVCEKKLEVGFVVSSKFQGNGYGKKIVKETILKAKELFPERKIVLYVKKNNVKAIHIYKKQGFKEVSESNGIVYMELQ